MRLGKTSQLFQSQKDKWQAGMCEGQIEMQQLPAATRNFTVQGVGYPWSSGTQKIFNGKFQK